MQIIADLHTHTLSATHAFNTLDEMAAKAAALGYAALAITDHGPAMPDAPHMWHFANQTALPLVLHGVAMMYGAEANVMDTNGGLDFAQSRLRALDWVVASIHSPCIPGLLTEKEATRLWLALAENPYVDCIGHSEQQNYRYDYDLVTKAFAKNHKVVELNGNSVNVRRDGIPNMKLDKSVIERRIKIMQAEGVEFRTNMDVGGAVAAEELLNGYDAVVLCCGAKKARDLNVPGRDANGVHFAVDYLTSVTKSLLDSQFADGKAIDAKGKNVLVIGGGDTGNDCQGTALRQGCTDLVALEMMPQPPKERAASNPWPEWPRVLKVDYGQTECLAKFGKDPRVYQTTVKEFLKDEAGNLTGAVISCLKPERDPETGRTSMVPTGKEFTYDCQLAFIAAGFTGCENYTADAFGVELTARGNVADHSFKTNVDKVFVCGDMRRGQSLVVWGLREGRDCAAEVDRYLMGYTNL